MEFIQNYYKALSSSIDYEAITPRLDVKYRDELCFKGMKVSYEDFHHVIYRDGVFIPKFLCDKIKKSDVVIDALPYLCVGVAEVFGVLAVKGSTGIRSFEEDILNSSIFFSIEEAANFTREFPYYDVKENENGIASVLTMRSKYVNTSFGDIKQLASMLYITGQVNPQLFAEALIHAMLFCYSFIDRFVNPDASIVGVNVTKHKMSGRINDEAFELCAIEYKNPNGKKVKISDDRGIGISLFALLMYHVVDRFGEPLSDRFYPLVNDRSFNYINDSIHRCIGDDFTGKYLTGVLRGLKKSNACMSCANRDFINSNKVKYEVNGVEVEKDFYEEDILVRQAYDLSIDDSCASLLGVHYYGIENITNTVGHIIANQETLRIFDHVSYTKDIMEMMENKVEGLQCSLDKSAIEKIVNKALDEQRNEFEKELEDYERRIRELQLEVDLKSDKCRQLSSEITSLNAELNSYYSDEDIETMVNSDGTSDLSIENMVEFLKDYSLVMVGGRNDLISSLNAIGLTDVTQIDNERGVTGVQADFVCLNTKFLSHKLTNLARERYKHQLDTMYYYNGTNIESLLRITYMFIKNYTEK